MFRRFCGTRTFLKLLFLFAPLGFRQKMLKFETTVDKSPKAERLWQNCGQIYPPAPADAVTLSMAFRQYTEHLVVARWQLLVTKRTLKIIRDSLKCNGHLEALEEAS